MKLLIQISLITLSCLFPKIVFSQNFTFTDSTFQEGNKFITYNIIFDFARDSFRENDTKMVDSLVDFCKANPNLVIEIGVHSDGRGSNHYATSLTVKRANTIRDYLIQNGILEDYIIAKGYEGRNLLISTEEIENLKTQEEKEKAHQKNRRIEITILKMD
ncbi:MAG: outer membrane protein OmpA-like peptidoglycan-associated protein [Parvicella sp.]